MLTLPLALQSKLDSGATTLCRCWRLTRRDGAELGFTDHDRPLSFDGVAFAPEAAVSASALERAEGLALDTVEIAGALRADAIREADVERGLYDGAEVRLWLVDWSEIDLRVLLFRGRLGEIRRASGPRSEADAEGEAGAFVAELHGLSERLNRPSGRQILATCDARLGDGRCGTDLDALRISAAVLDVEADQTFTVSSFEGVDAVQFSRGALTWTSGANVSEAAPIKRVSQVNGAVRVELWTAPSAPVSAGDGFEATPGCDKRWETCRDVYANAANFRGFPHTPGDDWVASYPAQGGRHDGASLNR